MKWPHLVAGVLLFSFAVAVGVESSQLNYWTALGPGPGFFPLWLSVLLATLSLLLFVRSLRSADVQIPEGFLPDRAGWLKIAIVLGAMVAVVLLLERVGFRLTMLGMYLAVLYGLGRRDFVVSPLIAIAGSFGIFHVFTKWLDVPLPTGPLGW